MIWLTQQTFDRLTAELEERRGPIRAEIVERISAARDEGDLKENGGYHAAKDEQGTNEARIRQLEDMLSRRHHRARDGRRQGRRAGQGRDLQLRRRRRGVVPARRAREWPRTTPHRGQVFSRSHPSVPRCVGHKTGETVDFEQPNGRVAKIEIVSAVPFSA